MRNFVIVMLIGVVVISLFNRRELMMQYMILTGSGAPPALLEPQDEGPGVMWADEYFTVEPIGLGTYAIGEPRYLQQNYSYLIEGTNRALLFDAGPGIRDIRATAEALTDKPITFLASHFHYDHVGNEVTFDHIAVVDLPELRERAKDGQLTLTDMEHLGGAEGFDAPTWQVDQWWAPGSQIQLGGRSLWLLYTPGHTTDSISLWDEANGMLFSGDYIYPGPLYGFLPNSTMRDYLATARTLTEMMPPDTRIYGAHRTQPPGAPLLERQDLVDLRRALEGIQNETIAGQGFYPQSFAVNKRMVMLAEPRVLQRW